MSTGKARAEEILAQALTLTSDQERQEHLDRTCGQDSDLRRELDALLAAHSQTPPDDTPPGPSPAVPSRAPGEGIGAVLAGRYLLQESLGEGGMGHVYLAQQIEPVQRLIAVKVIKAGLSSRPVLARFEQERQALALMDHPHIAKVFDAGTTEHDLPFFVMELVRGVRITKFCDEHQLTLRQRLELYMLVCLAIQHAHQKGIIHRDIKPPNVLVASYDGKPVPKVIDFGIAKATGEPLTDKTLQTGAEVVVGTPEYMSPEQADTSRPDVDTRSDIYALGVLLYELLTGTTPVDRKRLGKVSVLEILRIVREIDPPLPSTRLSISDNLKRIAADRRTEPARLTRLVRGELDWIVMKALEKDRSRRYATAEDLARDVERYLADEPVSAGPPSAAYRLKKMLRRHRGLALAVGLVLLTLVGGIIGTSWGWLTARSARDNEAEQRQEAEDQRQHAEQAEQKARADEAQRRAVLDFFQTKVLAAAGPKGKAGGLGRQATIRDAIAAAEPQIATAFADQPAVEAALRQTLGNTYVYLGDPQLAIPHLEKARSLRQSQFGPDHPDTLDATNELANACYQAGQTAEAIALYEEVLPRAKVLGAGHPLALYAMAGLALTYRAVGRRSDAVPLLEEALQMRRASKGDEDLETLMDADNLARLYLETGRPALALELLEPTVGRLRQVQGPDHLDTLISVTNLATAYLFVGRVNEAIDTFLENLKRMEKELGRDHPDSLIARGGLAKAYFKAGRSAEGLKQLEESLKLCQAKFGAEHPYTLVDLCNLAQANEEAGRPAEALRLMTETLRLRQKKLGADDPQTLRTMAALARMHTNRKDYTQAEALLTEAVRLSRQREGPDTLATARLQSQLGECLCQQKKFGEAEPLLLAGYRALEGAMAKAPQPDKAGLAEAAGRLMQFYEATGQQEEASRWRMERDRYSPVKK
jgi:serine/threonine protein kinase/tetratricopeptide (TPR) repeat protein